jgi:FkbM family methyltransferase
MHTLTVLVPSVGVFLLAVWAFWQQGSFGRVSLAKVGPAVSCGSSLGWRPPKSCELAKAAYMERYPDVPVDMDAWTHFLRFNEGRRVWSGPGCGSLNVRKSLNPVGSVNTLPAVQSVPPLATTLSHKDASMRSQSNEDEYALNHYFGGQKKGGSFLEIGGLDGISYSNTFFFEQKLDWRGVLVEANPTSFAQMEKNRPLAKNVHAAVCEKVQEVHWYSNPQGAAVSGIWEMASPGFRKSWQFPEVPDGLPLVRCKPLTQILESLGTLKIDFFSLDVEGAELAVAQTIDFSKVSFCLICVEADGNDKTKDEGVKQLFVNAGYVFDTHYQRSGWFYSRNCTDLLNTKNGV